MAEEEHLKGLNKGQKEAATHLNGPLLIVAGAGAGKTLEKVKARISAGTLDAEIIEVGCIGLCAMEPMLDIQLPDINGLALQEAMVARQLAIPIVFITGHGDIPMSVKGMKGGAIDFLPKPFTDKELLNAIDRAIAKNKIQTYVLNDNPAILEGIKKII